MFVWLSENWDAIAYLIGTLLAMLASAKVGQRRAERRIVREFSEDQRTPLERRPPKPPARNDSGSTTVAAMLLLLAAMLVVTQQGCAAVQKVADPYSQLRARQREAFEHRSAKWVKHLGAMHDICMKKAIRCGQQVRLDCPELVECQRFKADMATGYGAMVGHLARASDMMTNSQPLGQVDEALGQADVAWLTLEQRIEQRIKEYSDADGRSASDNERGGATDDDGRSDGETGGSPAPAREFDC